MLGLACLPALLDAGVLLEAAGARPADPAAGWFQPQGALLLYLRAPLAMLSASVFFLAPGLLLAPLLGGAAGPGRWLVSALAASLVVVSVPAALVQALAGAPLRGSAFGLLVLGVAAACAAVLLWRASREPADPHPAGVARTLVWAGLSALALAVVLAPKLHWEHFNGDGVHGYEAARLLLFQTFPFFSPEAGAIAHFPGLTSAVFVYPASWFIRLFGETEASARAPILLYAAVLVAVLSDLVRVGRRRVAGALAEPALALAVVTHVVVLGFSASYSPYLADLVLPATQDVLVLIFFLGLVLAFADGSRPWIACFALLTIVSQPGGLPLLCFFAAACLVAWRPLPQAGLRALGASVLGTLVLTQVAPWVLEQLGQPRPGGEYGFLGLLARLSVLQLGDTQRFLWWVVPAGILPPLALALWRRQDALARSLCVTTLAWVAFYHVQYYTSLHYFAPAMLLPVVVFWRVVPELEGARARGLPAAALVFGAVALFVSLPRTPGPVEAGRRVGETIDDRPGGYAAGDPGVWRRSELLSELFPLTWDPAVPESYGGSPLIWMHYASRRPAAGREINYVLDGADRPPPPGATRVAEEDGVALYVLRPDVWRADREHRIDDAPGSALYHVPRAMLFRTETLADGTGPLRIDLVEILEHRGFDFDSLRRRVAGDAVE